MEVLNKVAQFVRDIFIVVTKKVLEFLIALVGFIITAVDLGIAKPTREVMYWLNKNIYVLIVLTMTAAPVMFLIQEGSSKQVITKYIVYMFTLWVLKRIVEETGGATNSVPVPQERFTKQELDGGYSIEKDRLQEMILYVADVEEYLERTGKSKCKQRTK